MIEYKEESCSDAFFGTGPVLPDFARFPPQKRRILAGYPGRDLLRALLHTFCGQQCAQALSHEAKCLIQIRKACAAAELGRLRVLSCAKVLHGICG
jgi:hypothetical protein